MEGRETAWDTGGGVVRGEGRAEVRRGQVRGKGEGREVREDGAGAKGRGGRAISEPKKP